MSESPQAVFLSYASQDAEAAQRICDALRAAGIEVWFDRNELGGGDAWDQKIRRQIRECTLFVPILSRTTQARREAYFRLEWKLADERTHLMAKGTPFLLPITIDDTTERGALVPDSFVAVQWTKAPGGELPAAFCQRVRRLLAEPEPSPAAPTAAQHAVERPEPARTGRTLVIVGVLAVAALSAFGVWWARQQTARMKRVPATSPAAITPAPVAPQSEARKLADQALQLLDDPNFNRESSWLADELCERALKLDGGDAEVWAAAALASINLASNVYDTSSARREKARAQSQRALQLDRSSIRAGLAVARYEERWGTLAEALRQLQDLHRRAPDDQRVMQYLIRVAGNLPDEAAVQSTLAALRAAPRTRLLAHTLWFEMLRLRQQGRFVDAERISDELLQDAEPVRGAYYERFWTLFTPWHGTEAIEAFLPQIPARYFQEPAFGALMSLHRLMRNDPEGALTALARVPQDYFEEFGAREPKGLAAGWAHAMAGRTSAAQSEWRTALALVEERLKADPRVRTYLAQRALLLALLGQLDAAREARKLWVEFNGEGAWGFWSNPIVLHAALGERDEALAALERTWPTLQPGRRLTLLQIMRYHPVYADLRRDPRIERFIGEAVRTLQEEWRRQQQAASGVGAVAAPVIDEKSVAVLAFANLSDDKSNEYFSDGLSEELLNVLAKVPGLKVSARTSAFYFKGKNVPVAQIAQQLGVAYIVEGSVRRSGDKVRITAQLIKAADGFPVWNDSFTRDLKDAFAVQDEIAGLVANALSLKMGVAVRRADVPAEAYELYVRAREAWNLRTPAGYDQAEALLNRTLELAPKFAKAHAALSDVWELRAEWNGEIGRYDQRDSALARRIRRKVEEALALDPQCAEAYASLGLVSWNAWRPEEGERALRRAIELNPSYASAHQWLGRILLGLGRMDEALASLRRATEIDPLSRRILDNYGWGLNAAGRHEEALRYANRALELQPDAQQARMIKAWALIGLGRAAEAKEIVRPAPTNLVLNATMRSLLLARVGDTAASLAQMAEVPGDSNTQFVARCALGRREEALQLLKPSGVNFSDVDFIYFSPEIDPVRQDPRFRAVLTEVGLIEAHDRAQEWRDKNRPAAK
jgi:TolB-like protein/Tfp pilus assembly protein PilF